LTPLSATFTEPESGIRVRHGSLAPQGYAESSWRSAKSCVPNHEKNFSSPGARLAPSFNPPPIALRIFADAFSPARSADAFALPIPDLRANRSVALGVEAAEQIVAQRSRRASGTKPPQ